MRYDAYVNTALAAMAKLPDSKPQVFVLTSSHADVDLLPTAEGLAAAYSMLGKKTLIADLRSDGLTLGEIRQKQGFFFTALTLVQGEAPPTAETMGALVEKLQADYSTVLLVTSPVLESMAAMAAVRAASGVLMAEKRNLSRRDEIEKALEAIRNLEGNPVGFLLV